MKTPSRILNEKPAFLGLEVSDLAIVGYLLIITHSLLSPLGLELLSFPVVGIVTFLLVGIRLKNRPKIIRDFLISKMTDRIFIKNNSEGYL